MKKEFPIQKWWLLKYGIGFFLFGLILYLFPGGRHQRRWHRTIFDEIIVFVLLPLLFIYLWVQQRYFSFTFGDHTLDAQQGLVWKSEGHFPYENIQNVLITQDFGDRLLGIATVIIESAAGERALPYTAEGFWNWIGIRGNKIIIPGLTVQDAQKLKQLLIQRMKK